MFDEIKRPELLEEGKVDFNVANFFCPHCIDTGVSGYGWTSRSSVKSHVKSTHGYEHEYEEDCSLSAAELVEALDAWREINDGLTSRFERELCSIQTVEDFLFESGAEVWPAMPEDE